MKAFARLLVLGLMVAAGSARAADKADSFAIDQVMGKPDAKVTIVEYASTTCGHCATFHKEVLPRIKAEWVDTGKAKLIYRDFPTGPASLSIGASMLAHCAGPDRYFGVLGLIMAQQDKWMSKTPLEDLKKVVRVAGMTPEQVDACLAKQDLFDAIVSRAKAAQGQGIESTPTVVINGEKLVGVRAWAEYEKALTAASK